jgi:hypothetical protein
MTVPFIIGSASITVIVDGKTYVAKTSHPNFADIKDYLKAGAADKAKLAKMFDIPQAIQTKSAGRVTITNDTVFFDGKPLHSTLSRRMLSMLSEGFDISPLTNFLERLMNNPSNRAVTGLYDFLEATNIPITPDGKFLAYKKVRKDYYDIHSGTMLNAVGQTLRIPRNQVDENPDQTCSHGLHVCSASYLPHFGSYSNGDRVVIVEVDPADVVAIPRDYNNAKMRCAGYRVIGEVAPADVATIFSSAVMSEANFAPRAESDLTSGGTLEADETDVIRDIHGVVVRFALDYDDEWVAHFTVDGEDQEYATCLEDLEEAIEDFKASCMEEVADWTGQIRWLDEDGDLMTETVTVEWAADCQPDEDEFFETADVWEDGARVVNVHIVSGSKRWQLSRW